VNYITKTLTTLRDCCQTKSFFPVKDDNDYEISTTKGKLQQINSRNQFELLYFIIIIVVDTSDRSLILILLTVHGSNLKGNKEK